MPERIKDDCLWKIKARFWFRTGTTNKIQQGVFSVTEIVLNFLRINFSRTYMAQKDKRQQSVVVCYQGHDITDFVLR